MCLFTHTFIFIYYYLFIYCMDLLPCHWLIVSACCCFSGLNWTPDFVVLGQNAWAVHFTIFGQKSRTSLRVDKDILDDMKLDWSATYIEKRWPSGACCTLLRSTLQFYMWAATHFQKPLGGVFLDIDFCISQPRISARKLETCHRNDVKAENERHSL